jgi:hypothetical protein
MNESNPFARVAGLRAEIACLVAHFGGVDLEMYF